MKELEALLDEKTKEDNQIEEEARLEYLKKTGRVKDENHSSDESEKKSSEEEEKKETSEEEHSSGEDENAEEKHEEEKESEESEEQEEKTPQEKSGEEKKQEGKPDFEKEIVAEYVKELGISEDEAKEIVEREKAIAEKYKTPFSKDNHPLIKALRHQQQLTAQKDEELKKFHKPREEIKFERISSEALKQKIVSGQFQDPLNPSRTMTQDDIVTRFKIYRPDLARKVEDGKMDDETVFDLAVENMAAAINQGIEREYYASKEKAKNKRLEIIQNLPEKHKRYAPLVKKMLDNVSDNLILGDDFNVETFIVQAKGLTYDEDIAALRKEYEEKIQEAVKKAKQEKRILAQQNNVSSAGGNVSKGKPDYGAMLTDFEKTEALGMFKDLGDEKEAYQMYVEVVKNRKK